MQNSTGVYKKIAQVMGEVGAVSKDAKHGQGFQYQSIEAVVSALRGHMAQAGLIMLSECIASEDTGSQWVCDYRFTFVDVEDGSSHTLAWQQATPHKNGSDDKAMGKNHTYAQKYFLLRTFMITSKDDVDADTNDFKGEPAFTPKGKKQSSPKQNKTIDLDAWNKDNMTAFWQRWTGAGIDGSDILKTLDISALGQWKHGANAANERMEITFNKASGQ